MPSTHPSTRQNWAIFVDEEPHTHKKKNRGRDNLIADNSFRSFFLLSPDPLSWLFSHLTRERRGEPLVIAMKMQSNISTFPTFCMPSSSSSSSQLIRERSEWATTHKKSQRHGRAFHLMMFRKQNKTKNLSCLNYFQHHFMKNIYPVFCCLALSMISSLFLVGDFVPSSFDFSPSNSRRLTRTRRVLSFHFQRRMQLGYFDWKTGSRGCSMCCMRGHDKTKRSE